MPIAIDYHFLGQLEKECALNGYVPLPEKEKSGVTISTGFDLGARNQNDLRVLGIRGDLLNRLLPYLGLKGTKVRNNH